MSEWRPIETAPKDGSFVDLWCERIAGAPSRLPNCMWGIWDWLYYDEDSRQQNLSRAAEGYRPTHWMPLPPPPASEETP